MDSIPQSLEKVIGIMMKINSSQASKASPLFTKPHSGLF
jgi:hypothetical protein